MIRDILQSFGIFFPVKKGITPVDIMTMTGDTHIRFMDSEYKLYRYSDIVTFIAMDGTNLQKYVKNNWDCDKFTIWLLAKLKMKFKGIPAGRLETDTDDPKVSHHKVLFCDSRYRLHKIEPQNDNIAEYKYNKTVKEAEL